MLGIHSSNRITVDQTTKEFSIRLMRTGTRTGFVVDGIRLDFYKRTCKKSHKLFSMTPYAVNDGFAYFTIDDDFHEYSRKSGLYDVIVMGGDCEIDRFEMLKAPQQYISDIHTHNNSCREEYNKWKEPNHCEIKEKAVNEKKCAITSCDNMETIVNVKAKLGEKL